MPANKPKFKISYNCPVVLTYAAVTNYCAYLRSHDSVPSKVESTSDTSAA